MAYYDQQAYSSYHQSWNNGVMFDQEPCPPEFILKSQTGLSRSPSAQPMQRYLQETDGSYIFTGSFNDDMAMHAFSMAPNESFKYASSHAPLYPTPYQAPSPMQSGPSSYQSSNWSDRERTPYSSPDMGSTAYSPETTYTDAAIYGFGAQQNVILDNTGANCVALHDVQAYADSQPEKMPFEDENNTSYASFVHEGYQASSCAPSEQFTAESEQRDASEIPESTKQELLIAPVIRRRRPQPSRVVSSGSQPTRVTKRASIGKRTASHHVHSDGVDKSNSASCRSFACPFAQYGCASTFGSKNEWKRHCQTQHMRLGFWRCDKCSQDTNRPNDFNRKDLFIQHVRRMHPMDTKTPTKTKTAVSKKDDEEEQALAAASQRCYLKLRSAPTRSGCLFCEAVFEGPNTWDERMEHVGRHLEAMKKEKASPSVPEAWRVDEATEAWLQAEDLIVRHGRRWVLADGRA